MGTPKGNMLKIVARADVAGACKYSGLSKQGDGEIEKEK